ncbi:MAG: amino acid racemase [Pseudomonadota bacterium]
MTRDFAHLGILAHSAEGAALCFQTFCREGFARLGPHRHPDVTLDCIAMSEAMPAWEAGDYETVRAIHAESVDRLAAAGADFFVCPDNTSHIALEEAGRAFALPGLNIADVVADDAARRGMTKVGVLGTRFTMDGPVYRRALAERGVGVDVPAPDERADVDRIIFDELVEGTFADLSRARYIEIIEGLKTGGCDGVALVCTEIPLLISQDVSPLPILDSTRLLARAAFDVAVHERAMPDWRGGPIAGAASQRATAGGRP